MRSIRVRLLSAAGRAGLMPAGAVCWYRLACPDAALPPPMAVKAMANNSKKPRKKYFVLCCILAAKVRIEDEDALPDI